MLADIRAAFTFLTILPLGSAAAMRRPGKTFAWFPLVGLCIGALLLALGRSVGPPWQARQKLAAAAALAGGLNPAD